MEEETGFVEQSKEKTRSARTSPQCLTPVRHDPPVGARYRRVFLVLRGLHNKVMPAREWTTRAAGGTSTWGERSRVEAVVVASVIASMASQVVVVGRKGRAGECAGSLHPSCVNALVRGGLRNAPQGAQGALGSNYDLRLT